MENDFKKLSNTALVSQLKGLASRERQLTAEILRYLGEVQSRRLFLELGYSSLFAFCVRHLGFTEGETQRRISAMRVIKEIPEIESKVEQGSLSLSAVAQVASFCSREEKNLEEKKELLDQVSGKTTRECEKILLGASEKPEAAAVNKVTQVSLKQTKLTVTITPEVFEQLKKLKNLLSHKNPKMSYGELVAELAAIGLKKLDPSQKGVRGNESKVRVGAGGVALTEAPAPEKDQAPEEELMPTEDLAPTKDLAPSEGQARSDGLVSAKSFVENPVESERAQVKSAAVGSRKEQIEAEELAGFTTNRKSPLAQIVNLAACDSATCRKKQGEDEIASRREGKDINQSKEPGKGRRDHIPAHVRRQVWLRDKACCSFISHDKVKCQSTFMLELDHVEPVSWGGVSSYENLRLLCRNHNVHMAEKVLGKEIMRAFVAKDE